MATHDLTTPVHRLKTWPKFYDDMVAGLKTFEIRLNDRNFKAGERVTLVEFDPATNLYTGRKINRRIVYITDYLQREGYVVMQLA